MVIKKIICILCIFCVSIDAKLMIRRRDARERRAAAQQQNVNCCVDLRGSYVPVSGDDGEDEVNRLREQAIKAYDAGIYVSEWQHKERRAMDLQTKMGYTVPERFSWSK